MICCHGLSQQLVCSSSWVLNRAPHNKYNDMQIIHTLYYPLSVHQHLHQHVRVFYTHHPQAARSGPIIQEVNEEEDAYAYAAAQRPVVEEPDEQQDEHNASDDEPTVHQTQYHRPQQQQQHPQPYPPNPYHTQHIALQPFPMMMPFPSLLGGGMFGPQFGGGLFPSPSFPTQSTGSASYSYSSFSSSSTNGNITYSKTTTTRVGPNGVAETTEAVHDGRTGERRNRVARRLGDREHVVATTNTAHGYQEHRETLNNIRDEQERRQFEQEWQQRGSLLGPRERSRSLRGPSFERSVQPRLGDGRGM